jgi:hypothetical protein
VSLMFTTHYHHRYGIAFGVNWLTVPVGYGAVWALAFSGFSRITGYHAAGTEGRLATLRSRRVEYMKDSTNSEFPTCSRVWLGHAHRLALIRIALLG